MTETSFCRWLDLSGKSFALKRDSQRMDFCSNDGVSSKKIQIHNKWIMAILLSYTAWPTHLLMASRFDFYSFSGYEFLISGILFPLVTMLISRISIYIIKNILISRIFFLSVIIFSLVKCHRLPFKINCWYQKCISHINVTYQFHIS